MKAYKIYTATEVIKGTVQWELSSSLEFISQEFIENLWKNFRELVIGEREALTLAWGKEFAKDSIQCVGVKVTKSRVKDPLFIKCEIW